MIHLISRKYLEDTTDSMLFTPIVESVIDFAGKNNVTVWATSRDADVMLGTKYYLYNLIIYGFKYIKKNDTVFITSTPPFLSLVILFIRFFKKFRVVLQVQDLYPDIMNYLSFKYRIFYTCLHPIAFILYKKVDTFLTISDCIKEQIQKNYSIRSQNIVVVQNWTDIENISYSDRNISNKVIYIGNIGKAHDYSYFLEYLNHHKIPLEIVIKTDNTSKIKVFKSSKILANGLKDYILPNFISWNHTRYTKLELAKFLLEFDYSFVFLGEGFDRVLFPCKIYSSLSLLIPVIFFGPKDSFVSQWLEDNNLGFHYSKIEENYNKLNFYRESINQFNLLNPYSQKLKTITKYIIK